jgi:hypothetical protein
LSPSLYQDSTGSQCLLIERLVKSDAGWYTLSAINEAGMSTCNARLDVGSKWTLCICAWFEVKHRLVFIIHLINTTKALAINPLWPYTAVLMLTSALVGQVGITAETDSVVTLHSECLLWQGSEMVQ